MTEILGYLHLSLSVTDLDQSAEWYQEALGLDFDAEVVGQSFRRIRLRSPSRRFGLTLTVHNERSDVRFDERHTGMDHVAFFVGDVSDVEVLMMRFRRLGIEQSGVKVSDNGIASMTFRDPDNIQLEVFGGPGLG